ncbi:hypothetical protein KAI92_02305 [Candidatus Parcubacteria bacterium]|nr:hypothetical protein [Candidatus Parcubacteria bacterium]
MIKLKDYIEEELKSQGETFGAITAILICEQRTWDLFESSPYELYKGKKKVALALEIEIPGHDGMCVPPFNIWTKNRVYFLQTSESHNVAIIHSIPRNPSDEKTPLSVNG